MAREEYNLPLNKEAYEHLIRKLMAILLPRSVMKFLMAMAILLSLTYLRDSLLALSLQKLNFQLSKLPIHTLPLHGLLKMLLMILLIITVI